MRKIILQRYLHYLRLFFIFEGIIYLKKSLLRIKKKMILKRSYLTLLKNVIFYKFI